MVEGMCLAVNSRGYGFGGRFGFSACVTCKGLLPEYPYCGKWYGFGDMFRFSV